MQLGGEHTGWESFKSTFFDRNFPMELRKLNMQEFINLRQEGMSLKECTLKFTQLSKWVPTILAYSRDKMNKFAIGVPDLVEEECRMAMLISDMNISCLMVHSQQIKESKLKRKNREVKRARTGDGDFSKARSDGYGRLITQQKVSDQVSPILMVQ